MMMNKRFLRGIPALLLVFVLIFAACENGLTEIEGTVGISIHEAPNVTTVRAVKGGILLEWDPVLEAGTYTVWRKAPDAAPIQIASIGSRGGNSSSAKGANSDTWLDDGTGKFSYLDLVSDDNDLKDGTEYTYTVLASGGVKNAGKTEVNVTPDNIPEKGAKLDKVENVKLELNYSGQRINVSWTIPDESFHAQRYIVEVYRDGSRVARERVNPHNTSAQIYWSEGNQYDGQYEARVTATTWSDEEYENWRDGYFNNSDIVSSAKQDLFFVNASSIFANSSQAIPDDGGSIMNLVAGIYLGPRGKPGVAYTVLRAELDSEGNRKADYAPVSVYANVESNTPLAPADWVNESGEFKQEVVYDKSLPKTGGRYGYLIRATKGGVTQAIEIRVYADPREFAVSSINIAVPIFDPESNLKRYAVTPSANVKGALQDGDKLVFYYVSGDYDAYRYGYAKGIEFTKAELEAGTVVSKNLAINYNEYDYYTQYAYVQAYLEFADGSRRNVSSKIASMDGVNYVSSYDEWDGGNYTSIAYAQLYYQY